MIPAWKKLLYCSAAAAIPLTLFGFSTGPPTKRTGAAVDGGLNCTQCHTTFAPANSDTRGLLRIEASPYVPGQKQTVKVTISHPEGARWGFELTARLASDPGKTAGTLLPNESVQVRCDDGSQRGVLAEGACPNNQLEFAMHLQPGTAPNTSVSHTFEVQWTPPAEDAGDVIFYAAGNAANNSSSNAGDRIYTSELRIQNGGACTLTTRPNLSRVTDAAGYSRNLAMNSLMSLFGLNFQVPGRSRETTSGDIRNNRFPAELGCIAVEVNNQRVPLLYVQTDQINAQMPTITQTGNLNLQVILNPGRPNELRSDMATIPVQNYAPAFFTFNGRSIKARSTGAGSSVIADPTVFAGARPARPGEVIELYATGLGPTEPVYQAGEIAPLSTVRLRDSATVTIGGTTLPAADVQYAGLAPGAITGLYQINVRIPTTATDGDVPIVLRIGGVDSPAGATIPVRRQP